MTKNIYCLSCGAVAAPLHAADVERGFNERRICAPVKKPAKHYVLINGERKDLPSLLCDLCGAPIADGQKAWLLTLWRGADAVPELWESEYCQ